MSEQTVDLGCLSKYNLSVRFAEGGSVGFSRATDGMVKLLELYDPGVPGIGGIYVDKYDNPAVQTLGPIQASIGVDQFGTYLLNLSMETTFSDIKVLRDGKWLTVKTACRINLATGEIVNIY